jgi:hypothetical protein
VLARRGHSLEAWLFFPQLLELVELARAVPDLTMASMSDRHQPASDVAARRQARIGA